MPTISQFYGIIVLMHVTRKEHNPPHIHCVYGDYEATFSIKTGLMELGRFPSSGQKLVFEFINRYRSELLEMWETEIYKKLDPID